MNSNKNAFSIYNFDLLLDINYVFIYYPGFYYDFNYLRE